MNDSNIDHANVKLSRGATAVKLSDGQVLTLPAIATISTGHSLNVEAAEV